MNHFQRHAAVCILLVLPGLVVSGLTVADEPTGAEGPTADDGFTALFDGKSLDDWDGDPKFWRVEDGVIVGQTTKENNPQQNSFLIHRGGDFDDFELRLSYQVEGYNSGVQYRSVDQGDWSVTGYQCDFEARWHTSKNDPDAAPNDTFTGMFFDEGGRMFLGQRGEAVIVRTNPKNAKKPLIEKVGSVGDSVELETHIKRDGWNELIVIAKGNQFTHVINGRVMALGIDEDRENRRSSGLFAFQLHKGLPMKIQLKDIRVRRLSDSPASSQVSKTTTSGPAKTGDKGNTSFAQYALQHAGDPANGKLLFDDKRTNCSVCHKVANKGGDVGKDLSSIGGKFGRPHLIESLLEPSRQIVEGYRTTIAVTTDGKVVSGIIKSQDDAEITLADAQGKIHAIKRDDIDEQTLSSVSIMPEGLAKQLSPDEFTDLIAYLETLGAQNDKRGGSVRGAIEMPDGFVAEIVATSMDGLTALETLPDGRVLVCEQPGRVRVIENGKLLEKPFVSLPVDSYWERGVIGVTHDPEFPRKPYIYVCWVAKEPYPHHHVSRFTMKGNVAVEGSEALLLVGDDQTKMGGKVPAGHQGGALHFGPDGKLYIAIGEQTSGMPSQDLDTFLGKILRINADGSIPKDNPFVTQTKGKYQAIWAYGCRNPFTFAFRKSDGLMLINDVGGTFEEINVGRAGANYGWPVADHGDDAAHSKGSFVSSIHRYPQSSLNGGDFCPIDSGWPEQWRGKFFFADFQHGWIKTIAPNAPKETIPFLSGIRQPVDLRFATDGSLYVLLRNAWVIDDKFGGGTGVLLRIRPSAAAKPARKSAVSATRPTTVSIPRGLPAGKVVLTKDAVDESADGLPAFKIETESATYFLEKSGGGLSSLVDRDGKDWLGFHPKEGSGAGGEYRGFPNAVYKQGGSYFHAKIVHGDLVKTRVEHVKDGYVSIVAESPDEQWQGRYEFFATHCSFTMTKMPSEKKYWVLYEGTPGGELNLDDWWMTSSIKTPQKISKRHEGDIPSPEWIAFGDAGGKRSIVLLNHQDDDYPDSHYQMNEKMTVFGFGRAKLDAFHSEPGRRFSIGLVESTVHDAISDFVSDLADNAPARRDLGTTVQPAESATSVATPKLGPKPGDVYREYTIHNGGNFNWRVTDPRARHDGAKEFLPNPVLSLNVRDLEGAIRAEAVLDRWGGHAGTKGKMIRFNENDWISLPELTTTPEGHPPEQYHSQDNPVARVPLSNLVKGDNTIEGTVGPANKVGWGQWGFYSLILRIYYDPEAKNDVAKGKIQSPTSGMTLAENPTVKLECDGSAERIDVLAWYDGYDENGDGVYRDWHGGRFQPLQGHSADLQNHVGTIDASQAQRTLNWDTHWVPDQDPGSIKFIARVHHGNGLIYVTDIVDGLSLKRGGLSVKQYRAKDVPEVFSVRVGRSKSCNISIDSSVALDHATEAVLHYRTWEADDRHHNPFQLNGHEHKNQGKNHHYDYDLLPIPVSQLKLGNNTFSIQSDTEHHMLEVLWPGPAITVRYQTE